MALYIPHSIFNLARLLYVRPENFEAYYVRLKAFKRWILNSNTSHFMAFINTRSKSIIKKKANFFEEKQRD